MLSLELELRALPASLRFFKTVEYKAKLSTLQFDVVCTVHHPTICM